MITITNENVATGMSNSEGVSDVTLTNYTICHNAAVANNLYPAGSDANRAGQKNTADGGLAGADSFIIWRTGCIFAIPASVGLLSRAILEIKFYAPTFVTPQYIYVLDSEGDIANTGVILADYGQMLNHTTEWGKIHSSTITGAGYWEIELNALARAAIAAAAGGYFYCTLRTYDDINSVMPASSNNENAQLSGGGGSLPPKLYLFPGGRNQAIVIN